MTAASQIPFTINASAREGGEEHFRADLAQLLEASIITASGTPAVDDGSAVITAIITDSAATATASVSVDAAPEIAIAAERWQAAPSAATKAALEVLVAEHIEDTAVSSLGVYLDIRVEVSVVSAVG